MKNKVFRRFLRRKVSVAAAIILLTIILACIFGPMFIHHRSPGAGYSECLSGSQFGSLVWHRQYGT